MRASKVCCHVSFLGGEAPTDGFGVSGVESSVLLIMESITVLGLLDPKMTAFNVSKHLPNDTP